MSSRRNIIILVVAVLLIFIFGLYLFATNLTEWMYTLDKDKKSPYGLYVTNRLLKHQYGDNFIEIKNSVIETFRELDPKKKYNYVYISHEAFYDTAVVDTLMKFVAAGNTAFIAVDDITGYLRGQILSKEYHLGLNIGYNFDDSLAFAPPDTTTVLTEETDEEYIDEDEISYDEEDTADIYYDSTYAYEDSVAVVSPDSTFFFSDSNGIDINPFFSITKAMSDSVAFNFTHPAFKARHDYIYFKKFKSDTLPVRNLYFEPLTDTFHNYPMQAGDAITYGAYLRYKDTSRMNMVILKHGKGNLIILLTTLPFTNYFMRKNWGLDYAEKIFAHLPNKNLIWDDVSNIYEGEEQDYHGNPELNESPLYFVLKNTQLKWAWYLILLGILIYALFRAKRRQQIIPLIEPKQNTSLQYVETIGQLYFHENEHIEIAVEMRNQLLNYIRNRYQLKTNDMDDAFFAVWSLKSGIEEDKLRELIADYDAVAKFKSIDNAKLADLNNKTEYFYNHCK